MLYGNFIFPHFPYVSHALIGDWYAHAQFFTFFFYGFLIGRDKAIWAEFARLRWLAIALAVVAFAAVLIQRALFVEGSGFWAVQASAFIIYFNRWIWIVAVLGWGHHWLKRPMPWLPYATEAVYPWYILHQTIIVVAGVCLSRLALGSVTEPVLVLVATIGGCFVLHEYVIRRTPILRPLFGLSYRPSGLTLAAAAGKATPAAANPSSTR
jgi:hypothetical protein